MSIPRDEWQWFGSPGHFICSYDCRFHLCTQVGKWLVSTVGQYLPDESIREHSAERRGIRLVGKGDARRADYMARVGYEEIGYNRTFETMVFRAGAPCMIEDCGCLMPSIVPSELDMLGYNDAGAATRGHMALCEKWAAIEEVPVEVESCDD